MSDDRWELYAIRYARHERTAAQNFLGGDLHDGPMPLDFFVWLIRNERRQFVVDSGFDEAMAGKRDRTLLRPVGEGLKALGCDPERVEDVIVTHMHYDHAGNPDLFARARYHVQDAEMAWCTGRAMGHALVRAPFEAGDVQAMVGRIFADRVVFHDGDEELAPGVSVHRVGGHTRGLQVVRVRTGRGHVVLASDAAHFYANWHERRPFPILDSVADYLEALRRVERLADSLDHVIPGHDPLVLHLYPSAGEGIARLDLPPR